MNERPRYDEPIITSSTAKHQINLELQEKREDNPKKRAGANSAGRGQMFSNRDEHRITLNELYTRLSTNPENGLSDQDAELRRMQYGPNMLTEPRRPSWYEKLFHELAGFFFLPLYLAAGMSFILYGLRPSDPSPLFLALALLVMNLCSSITNFLKNQSSEAVMEGFKNFIPIVCQCLRNGSWTRMNASTIVPGDIIQIRAGDRVPADIRIIQSDEMKVDNSALTGASDILLRTVECTHPDHPLETMNLAFFGALCREGSGKGVVIATGDQTVMGQITVLATNQTGQVSSLVNEVNNLVVKMSSATFVLGLSVFFLALIIGYSFVQCLVFAIGVIIANMPEGILTTILVGITYTAQRLATANVLVKNLEAVETLGCTTAICVDKTGVITQNSMAVSNIWYDNTVKKADNLQKLQNQRREPQYDPKSRGFVELHETAIISSDAIFDNNCPDDRFSGLEDLSYDERAIQRTAIQRKYQEELQRKPILDRPCMGDASETALIKFFQPIEDIKTTRERYPTLKMNDYSQTKLPFNSTNKFAINIVEYETPNSHHCIFMKGAPERVWRLCSHISINGEIVEINQNMTKEFEAANLRFGMQGERVLGFAKYHLPKDKFNQNYQYNVKTVDQFNFPLNKLVFLGLISVDNPPKASVSPSVIKCKNAGIKVIMITGDQPLSAAAIAKKADIFDQNTETVNEIAERLGVPLESVIEKSDAIVITGDMIAEAAREDETLPKSKRGNKFASWLCKPQIVFARTSPVQKLAIVQELQNLGHTVALSGDGVSDTPAIKKADVGIAMGITGSDVAKDAADLILLTDDFSAIITGVEEGRKVFDNLKRSIIYTLTSNFPELILSTAMMLIGLPMPITPILMLFINLGTDLLPALSLAWEDGEPDLMMRPPRSKNEQLFTARLLATAYIQRGGLQVFGALLCYFYVMNDFGFPPLQLVNLQFKKGLWSTDYDIYDPYRYDLGNPHADDFCGDYDDRDYDDRPDDSNPHLNSYYQSIDWGYLLNARQDLRNIFIQCDGDGSVLETVTWGECRVKQLSSVTNLPNCYSTEALKYAQTSVFLGIVIGQIINLLACKSNKRSLFSQRINNMNLAGIACAITITFVLSGWTFLHKAIGSRDPIIYHYGIPALPFAILQLIIDEARKYFNRRGRREEASNQKWIKLVDEKV